MAQDPIALYYWPTPNGRKVSIMLEELGLPYEVHPIDITRGAQFDRAFLEISPNNKIPAIVDPNGPGDAPYPLADSGAILIYLANKSGRFHAHGDPARYYRVLQWLMFQMGHVGPMAGQAHHFRNYAPETIEYAAERYTNEVQRLYRVMDRQLAEREYLAGEYSIADMACWPWVRSYENQGQDIGEFPHLKRWFESIGERPAVERALEVLADRHSRGKSGQGFDEQARNVLFGNAQFERR